MRIQGLELGAGRRILHDRAEVRKAAPGLAPGSRASGDAMTSQNMML
jgi:hypothetical protein